MKTRREIGILFLAILSSTFLASFLGVLQMAGKFIFPWNFAKSAAFNTVGSANSLEILAAAALVMAATLFVDKKRPRRQAAALAAVSFVLLFGLMAMNFANVWLVLIGVMAAVIGIGVIKKRQASQTRLVLAMAIFGMAVLLTFTKINIAGEWLQMPAEVAPSFRATLDISKGALSDDLFFGSGP
jgi:hypothetical protein